MKNLKKITIMLFLTILTITLVGCGHKHEHIYGEWITTIEATCTSTGTKERVCSNCKQKESMVIPIDANAHSTTSGKCSYCGINSGFENLKSYVKRNGKYSDGEYQLTFYTENLNGTTNKFYLRYDPTINDVWISYFSYESSVDAYLISIVISDNSIYNWTIVDSDGYKMSGNLYPATYNDNSSLTYTYTNIIYSELKDAFLEYARTCINLILFMYKTKITNTSISLYNLGFKNYY